MTSTQSHWQAIFGSWEDHSEHLPIYPEGPVMALSAEAAAAHKPRRMTVDEAVEASIEFAHTVMQGYRTPSEHDDFHSPAEDVLQSMLMELYVRDNRTAKVIYRAINMLKHQAGEPVEYRLHTDRCEYMNRIEQWPFMSRCGDEGVTSVDIADEKMVLCQDHWNDYLTFKVETESKP